MKLKFFRFGSPGYPLEMVFPFEKKRALEITEGEYIEAFEENPSADVVAGFLIDGKVRVAWIFPERYRDGGWTIRYHTLERSYPGEKLHNLRDVVQVMKRVARPPAIVSAEQAYEAGRHASFEN